MIKLTNIHKYYKSKHQVNEVLKGIDLHVKKGEICGIIGKSGAGKSTLLRCINLLAKPDSGDVSVDGVSLLSLNELELRQERRKIGMIFQHFNLLSSLTVYKNIAFPLELSGLKKHEIEERVQTLLHVTGLTDKKNHYPDQLSGGQKQRVAIARALAPEPFVLLCDEATSSLDPETSVSILNLLKEINQKLGLTIVLITHEIKVVKFICNKVVVLDSGKIVEEGSVSEILANPFADITKSLVNTTF